MKSNDWVEFKNIDICYKNKTVLKNLNLRISSFDNTVIIGSNGSGKSTIIKAIVKLIYPLAKKDSYIKLFNLNNINIWELRTRIGFVLTEIDSRIKSQMITSEVILSGYQGTFGLVNKGLINSQDLENYNLIVKNMDLETIINIPYNLLSDGQKRRVLIARAIINNPKVLILDEPTSMLDIKSKFKLLRTLSLLSSNGITLLYSTNNIENIIPETNRIILLKDNNIIADGEPHKIITSENISSLYDYQVTVLNKNGYWAAMPAI